MRRQLTWTMCLFSHCGWCCCWWWWRGLLPLEAPTPKPKPKPLRTGTTTTPHCTTPYQATSLHPARLDSMVAVSFRRRSQEPSNQPKADDEALKVSYNNTINNNSQLPTTESQKQDDIGLGLWKHYTMDIAAEICSYSSNSIKFH